MLKQIGIAARKELESFLGVQVHLELFVKIADDWRGSAAHFSTHWIGGISWRAWESISKKIQGTNRIARRSLNPTQAKRRLEWATFRCFLRVDAEGFHFAIEMAAFQADNFGGAADFAMTVFKPAHK